MSEQVEVRPRYADPDAVTKMQAAQAQAAVVTAAAETTSLPPVQPGVVRGLFTSMYDNKIIVLIIVIAIVIIGIVAYIILRKEDDDKPKPRKPEPMTGPPGPNGPNGGNPDGNYQLLNPPPQMYQQAQPHAQAQMQPQQPQMQPQMQPQQQVAQSTQQSPQQLSREELQNLLARGQAPAQPTSSTQPIASTQPTSYAAKSNDDIMQLMEDESADAMEELTAIDTDTAGAATTENTETTDDEEQQASSQSTMQTVVISPATSAQDPYCTYFIQPGRRCKAKATQNGRCFRHPIKA